MAIQRSIVEKLYKDHLAIFKLGLWLTGFFECSKEKYHFQQQLMVSNTINFLASHIISSAMVL